MAIIGKNSIGGSSDNWNDDQYLGTKFTAGQTGILQSVTAYIADAYAGGFDTFSVAIYSVTGGLMMFYSRHGAEPL